MALTSREFEMLNGLRYSGNTYLSASEHNVALALCERGLAQAWTVASGFHAWRITEAGLSEIVAEEKRLRS